MKNTLYSKIPIPSGGMLDQLYYALHPPQDGGIDGKAAFVFAKRPPAVLDVLANVPAQFEQDQIIPRFTISVIMGAPGIGVGLVICSIDVRVHRMPAIKEIRRSTQWTRLLHGPLVDACSMVQMVARQFANVFRDGLRVQRAEADAAYLVARIPDAFLPQGMCGVG